MSIIQFKISNSLIQEISGFTEAKYGIALAEPQH
jgi:hypothetical protein